MNGRYRVTVLAVELYDPLLIQRAIARAGGDGKRWYLLTTHDDLYR